MTLVAAYTRAQLLELARYPTFLVPTLAFPSMFFLFFVVPRANAGEAQLLMASYAAFAVLAIAFFQFGVGVAIERASPWEVFLRTLPARALVRFTARVLSALVFAAAAATVVIAVALVSTDAALAATQWPAFLITLMLGSVPFALLGIAIGYWTTPRGALPIANILYLALSYLGGFWTTGEHLPSIVNALSPALPTRQWVWLIVYACAFALLAGWGYRRDEGERFS
jgi:ABC-2 type transport system permease protein